jgi:hypothetical protein
LAAGGEGEGVPKKLLSSSRETIFLDLARIYLGGVRAISPGAAGDFCPEDIEGLGGSCAGGTVSIFTTSSNGEGDDNLILLF